MGLFAALLVTLLAGFMLAAERLFGRLKAPAIAKSTLGGVVFGIIGVPLSLTMFSGSDQLTTVLKDARTLGLGLLAAILIAKMLTFAVSQGSGFVGGPIFPSLFIGGTAGVLVHQVIISRCATTRPTPCRTVLGRWGRRRRRRSAAAGRPSRSGRAPVPRRSSAPAGRGGYVPARSGR
jgi:H+/Cl- antiporter ClcA